MYTLANKRAVLNIDILSDWLLASHREIAHRLKPSPSLHPVCCFKSRWKSWQFLGHQTPLVCPFFCLFSHLNIPYHLADLIPYVFGFDHQFYNVLHIYPFINADFGLNSMFHPSVAMETYVFRGICLPLYSTYIFNQNHQEVVRGSMFIRYPLFYVFPSLLPLLL